MSKERSLERVVVAASLAVAAGCSKISLKTPDDTPTSSATPTATFTPMPTATFTPLPPTLNPWAAEMTRIAPLTTPGAADYAIISTAEAFKRSDIKEIEAEGVPEVAINSSAVVSIFDKKCNIEQGSGTLMHISGYWVVLTVGHLFNNDCINLNELRGVQIERLGNLPNLNSVFFPGGFFGYSTAKDRGIDFAVVVIPDDNGNKIFNGMFDQKKTLQWDQLFFGKIPIDDNYSAICFPGITGKLPTVSIGSRVQKFDPWYNKSTLVIDNSLIAPGCSGGGMYVTTAGETFYAGPIQANNLGDSWRGDATYITTLSSVGEDGLRSLIIKAIGNYKTGWNQLYPQE